MPAPTLSVRSVNLLDVEADVLVIGVSSEDGVPVLVGAGEGFGPVTDVLSAVGITGARDELRRIPAIVGAAGSIALVGLGTGTDAAALRYAAGTAARGLTGVTSIALALPTNGSGDLIAVLEGAAIGAYSFNEYRSGGHDPARTPASDIVVVAEAGASEVAVAVERAAALSEAVHLVRDLVNTPPADLYPGTFAERARVLCEPLDVGIEVLAEDELVAGGFGGIIGVGQGSSRGPRLVKVTWEPASATRHLALVGKGITFDSGGLSLKPPASMVGMKYDMTGAATVLAVVLATARLALPVRVTAWLCLAENMPSGTAIRPNDVLTLRGGSTVEVLNTDAEGRLVLADGLVAAGEENPDAIIDVATLTGAAIVAMGNRYVAAMGDDDLVRDVVAAAGSVGEPFWPMPLPAELRSLLDSDVADIANAKIGNTAGGMLLAGVFLREFVGRDESGGMIPWVHLDIAGAANNGQSPYGFTGKGSTGVAVRALVEFAERFAEHPAGSTTEQAPSVGRQG